ncbi:hypothetical protein [Streptomyces sp. NPDC005303]|uniref:hypothetical protein n=1 Tax=Streptomyces sp. NPDC005303 TaxID=3155713 RepID=UPI0033B17FB1
MIADAVDTVITLGWALCAWILLCAATATLGLYAVVVAVAWPCRTAREAVAGALAASRAVHALDVHRDRYRPSQTPSWAAA